MAIAADPQAYEWLAEMYRKQGDMNRWKETLDKFLSQEDVGLDHARIRVEIARHFMREKRWDDAWPYAEMAANTWAGWAMLCAAECAEGRNDWETAEQYVQRVSARYDNSLYTWFMWCKRTGHGDVQAARRFTEEAIRARQESIGSRFHEELGLLAMAAGDLRGALKEFRESVAQTNSPTSVLYVAMLADVLGDAPLRDRHLEIFCTDARSKTLKTARICQLFRDTLAQGDTGKLDLNAVDAVIRDTPEAGRGSMEFIVGRFLETRGRHDEARRYFQRCLVSETRESWPRTMAWELARPPR
jgi:tetratricopeptide (TPR) repeat protein